MTKKTKKKDPSLKEFQLHHKILFTIVGVVGSILIWRGVWEIFDATPILDNPWISTIVGILLIFASGAFFKLI